MVIAYADDTSGKGVAMPVITGGRVMEGNGLARPLLNAGAPTTNVTGLG